MSGAAQRALQAGINAEFAASVLDGLGRPQKRLEPRYFYDAEGSRLFDRICELEEYYPTRVETGILRAHAVRLCEIVPAGTALVELGSGSSLKTRILLDTLPSLSAYIPIDISAEHLSHAATRLAPEYPMLAIPLPPTSPDRSRCLGE